MTSALIAGGVVATFFVILSCQNMNQNSWREGAREDRGVEEASVVAQFEIYKCPVPLLDMPLRTKPFPLTDAEHDAEYQEFMVRRGQLKAQARVCGIYEDVSNTLHTTRLARW